MVTAFAGMAPASFVVRQRQSGASSEAQHSQPWSALEEQHCQARSGWLSVGANSDAEPPHAARVSSIASFMNRSSESLTSGIASFMSFNLTDLARLSISFLAPVRKGLDSELPAPSTQGRGVYVEGNRGGLAIGTVAANGDANVLLPSLGVLCFSARCGGLTEGHRTDNASSWTSAQDKVG